MTNFVPTIPCTINWLKRLRCQRGEGRYCAFEYHGTQAGFCQQKSHKVHTFLRYSSTKEWQGLAKSMQGKHHVFWRAYELCPTYSYCNIYIIFVNISHLCSVCYFKDLFPSGSCMLDRADRCFHCLDGRWIVAGHLRDVWTLQLSVDMLMFRCSTMQSATIP